MRSRHVSKNTDSSRLIRIRNGINNPVPGGNAFYLGRRVLEIAESLDEVILQGLDAVEGAVVEMFLAQLVPEMFLGIQFGGRNNSRRWSGRWSVWLLCQPAPSSTMTTLSSG